MGVLLINTVLLIVMIIVAIVLCVIGVIVGFNLGVAHRKKIAEGEFGSAEEKAKSIVKDAEKAADESVNCCLRLKKKIKNFAQTLTQRLRNAEMNLIVRNAELTKKKTRQENR